MHTPKSNIVSLADKRQKQQQNSLKKNKIAPQLSLAEELINELELRDSLLIQAFERIEELEKRQAATFKLMKMLVAERQN